MAPAIPQPIDSDPEDVQWALNTAQSLLSQGDHDAALRWLRKAVSAAVTSRHDGRALELGRWAAQLEDSLGLALTQRGAEPARAFDPERTEADTRQHRLDLDQPTHVDTPRGTLVIEDTSDDAGTDSEITLVPFTMKAASAGAPPAVRRVPEPRADGRPGARTLQVAQFPPAPEPARGDLPPFVEDHDESTVAMTAAPNAHEIADHDSLAASGAALAAVPRHRVALVASPDGHDPRVLPLARGAAAPAESGVAILIPVSSRDAQRIAQLLGIK